MPVHVNWYGGVGIRVRSSGGGGLVGGWGYSSTRAVGVFRSGATPLTQKQAGGGKECPFIWLLRAAWGGAGLTVSASGAEVPRAPRLSTAWAVRRCAPTVRLLQV